MSAYQYKPLDQSLDEIRIVTLSEATEESDPVTCTLTHVSLDHAPHYQALSYHWGDASVTRDIDVNDCTFSVTGNLEAALRELRAQRGRRLWIDAICIDQADLEERNRQVLRMGEIYSKAEKVIVWLGIGSDDSDLAVDLFEALALGERNADASDDDLNWETAIDWMYEPSIYHRYVNHWAAFDSLLERRYWKRVWIIQEIAFGTRVLCQCGSRSFWWSTLASAIKKIRDLDLGKVVIQDQPSKIYMNAETINGIERMRSYRRHADCYLLKILRSVGDAVSTDPKDRIYGFLALANDGKQLLPHPDYGLSIEDVYIETMRRIISDNRDLDVML